MYLPIYRITKKCLYFYFVHSVVPTSNSIHNIWILETGPSQIQLHLATLYIYTKYYGERTIEILRNPDRVYTIHIKKCDHKVKKSKKKM